MRKREKNIRKWNKLEKGEKERNTREKRSMIKRKGRSGTKINKLVTEVK